MVEIDTKLYNEIKLYCKANNLIIKDFINKLLKKSFTIEKYGETPFASFINGTPHKLNETVTYSKPTENHLEEKSIPVVMNEELMGKKISSYTHDEENEKKTLKNETNKNKKRIL